MDYTVKCETCNYVFVRRKKIQEMLLGIGRGKRTL